MLVVRRSAEKTVSGNINSMAMSWLQQAFALPFIVFTLFFAKFYLPSELSEFFWITMMLYVMLLSIDIFCYFKALSLADISYIAPIMTLVAVGNILGAHFVLNQDISLFGFAGAGIIVCGAALVYHSKKYDKINHHANRAALLYILLLVVVRSYASNIEVTMVRESNPISFNFYSSVLTVPFILIVTTIVAKTNRNGKFHNYWKTVKSSVHYHKWLLLFIGITYTINMLATYQAKLISPNAGYVGAIKSASVLPMVLVGVILFKEKIVRIQWIGLVLIFIGLVSLAMN